MTHTHTQIVYNVLIIVVSSVFAYSISTFLYFVATRESFFVCGTRNNVKISRDQDIFVSEFLFFVDFFFSFIILFFVNHFVKVYFLFEETHRLYAQPSVLRSPLLRNSVLSDLNFFALMQRG